MQTQTINKDTFYKAYPQILSCTKLTIYERHLLTYIMSFPEKCWASTRTISNALGISISSVKKAYTSLAKKGILQITITKNKVNVDVHILVVCESNLAMFLEEPVAEDIKPAEDKTAKEVLLSHANTLRNLTSTREIERLIEEINSGSITSIRQLEETLAATL